MQVAGSESVVLQNLNELGAQTFARPAKRRVDRR